MRYILLLFLLSSFLSGASYDDEWPVYVYGDASYYKVIFDGIAIIVQNDAFMDPFIGLIALSSFLFVARGFYSQNIADTMWNTAAGIGFITMLLYPSSTVHVLDVRTLHGYVIEDPNSNSGGNPNYAGYSKIDNIPFYIAATASFATAIKYSIIDIATDALTPVNGGSLRDSGFATPMTIAEDMITTASFKHSKDDSYIAPLFGQALSHYVEKCVIENALFIDQTKIHSIRDPKISQLEAISPDKFTNFHTVKIEGLNGGSPTCTEFWNANISSKMTTVKKEMIDNLQLKHPKTPLSAMAENITFVAGVEADAATAFANMQKAMVDIATTSVIMNAFEKAGAGLSGIDLSNEMTAQQSLAANMIDSTGQFKWMIRVVPILEFLIFGILLFLAIPMAFVAGISGFARGGKMLMNYTFGLIAFSFVDVALAIVQSISLFYYNNKMSDVVLSLGGNPFTASGITPYLQEMAYMSGMMGLAAVIVVPITVGVVFKGETAAAMGAYNSVMGKYKGDQGGQTALDASSRAAATHASEAQQHEEAARRELGSYGINSVPRGVMASQYLDQISAQAAALSGSAGAMRVMDSEYGGDFQKFAQNRARAGMGTSMQKVGSEIGSGNGVLDAINGNSGSLGNFMHQAGTSAAAGFMSQAAMGKFSKDNKDYDREAQVKAAQVMANDGLVKSVQTAKGLVDSGAFDKDGNIGNAGQFGLYADGMAAQSRIQANKTMGAGFWSQTKSEAEMKNAMADIQRTEHASIKALVAKGDSLQKSFGNNLDGKLNGQTYDAMIRAQEMGNFSASTQAIKTAGGESAFVALQKASSSMKTAQSMTSVAANEAAGFLDANGNMTSKGMEAFAITPTEQASSLNTRQEQMNNQKFQNKKYKGAQSEGANVDEFLGKDGSAKTGLELIAAEAASRARKFSMKDSLVDGDGKEMGFALDSKGNLGRFSLDGQTKIANGVSVDTGGQVAALAEGFNMTESAIKDGHRVDIQNGKLVGNKASKEAFMKHIGNNQKNQAIVTGAPGEFLTVLQDLADEFTPDVVADNFGKVAFAAVMGVAGRKAYTSAKNALGFSQKPSDNIKHSTSDKDTDKSKNSVNHSNTSEHKDNIKNYTEDYQKSQELRDNEIKKATDLKKQRNRLYEQGKDVSSFDEKIADSYKKAKVHQSDMDIADRNIKAEKYMASKDVEAEKKKANGSGGSKGTWLSALAVPLANEAADLLGIDKSDSLVLSGIEAGAEVMDGGFNAVIDTSKAALGGGFKAIRGDADAGQYFLKNIKSAGSSITDGINNASDTFATYAVMQEFNKQQSSPAPQHQGFTTLPMGHNTLGAMEQHFTATQQQNAQAMSNISPTSRYVGFSATDADGNQVNFSTSKQTRNLTVDGYDTGMPAQQFSGMMQSPDAVNQFATAISQTSFSGNQEAYASTNSILMDMNAQTQRANTQTKVRTNSIAMSQEMKQAEFMEALLKKDVKEDEF